ncbi:hypothetical protein [Methanobrevibacter curvatus]|nr:hypothetical protein [Methanobrevibacter curvatus]
MNISLITGFFNLINNYRKIAKIKSKIRSKIKSVMKILAKKKILFKGNN